MMIVDDDLLLLTYFITCFLFVFYEPTTYVKVVDVTHDIEQ